MQTVWKEQYLVQLQLSGESRDCTVSPYIRALCAVCHVTTSQTANLQVKTMQHLTYYRNASEVHSKPHNESHLLPTSAGPQVCMFYFMCPLKQPDN